MIAVCGNQSSVTGLCLVFVVILDFRPIFLKEC